MNNVSSLDDFTKKLIPITYLRRHIGTILKKLSKEGPFIITKGGKPVAILSSLEK